MIDQETIAKLSELASIHDVDDEWHHADECGFSVRLVGETLSNAYPPSAKSNEACLVVMYRGPKDRRSREVAVLNVATLLADAEAMYGTLHELQRLLKTNADNLQEFLL